MIDVRSHGEINEKLDTITQQLAVIWNSP